MHYTYSNSPKQPKRQRSDSDEELGQDMSQLTEVQRQQLMYDKFEREKRESVLDSVDRDSPQMGYNTRENEQDRIQREGQARRREIEKNDELTRNSGKFRRDRDRSGSTSDSSDREDSYSNNSNSSDKESIDYITFDEMKALLLTREKFQDVRTKLKVAEIVKFMFVQIHVGNVNHEELRVFIVSGLEKSEGPDKSTQYKLKIMRPVMRKEQLIGVDKISNKSLSRDAYEAIINEAKRVDETKYRILESKVAETKIEENRSLIKQVDSEKDILGQIRGHRTIIDEKMEAENRLAQARENGDEEEINMALKALKEIDNRSSQRKKVVVHSVKTHYDISAFSNPEAGFGRLYHQDADAAMGAETKTKTERAQKHINLGAYLEELHDFDVQIEP